MEDRLGRMTLDIRSFSYEEIFLILHLSLMLSFLKKKIALNMSKITQFYTY